MWIPKWYFEARMRQLDEMQRRIKRLEGLMFCDAKNKIASFSEGKVGRNFDERYLTIEEIVKKSSKDRKICRLDDTDYLFATDEGR